MYPYESEFRAGLSLRQIARAHATSHETVRARLIEAGVIENRPHPQDGEIARRYAEGMGIAQIAEALAVSGTTVQSALKRRGVTTRLRGRPKKKGVRRAA